jgi:pyruvate formate lyase activating enzyme
MIFGGLEKLTLIDFPGKVACVAYTIGCNFRCPYCHNRELVEETVTAKITEEEIFALLQRKKGLLDGVVITGGEPTLHGEDLLRFMAAVKERGFLVKLDTNGTNPGILRTALERHLADYVAMDIKAPFAKYSAVVARPVDLDAVRESIQLLIGQPRTPHAAAPIPYEFRTTVVKSLLSPADLEDIGREIRGAERYYLQKFIASPLLLNPQFKKKLTYSNAEFKTFQETLHHYVQRCEIR